jgi:hypothetical protein
MTKTAKLLLPYEKKWVAINRRGDKILASAKNVKVLSDRLDSMGVKKGDAVLTWVFPFRQAYAPFNV